MIKGPFALISSLDTIVSLCSLSIIKVFGQASTERPYDIVPPIILYVLQYKYKYLRHEDV